MSSLDRVLESLGDQVVPPNLHQMGTGSSLFGSHHSSLHGRPSGEGTISPSDPLAGGPTGRASWKTLRDFVDERAIEEAMERMEQDRTTLDVRQFARFGSICFRSEDAKKQIGPIGDDHFTSRQPDERYLDNSCRPPRRLQPNRRATHRHPRVYFRWDGNSFGQSSGTL